MTTPSTTTPSSRLRYVVAGIVLAVASTAALSTWAFAGGGHRGGPMAMWGSPEGFGRMADHLLDGLNATDAQRAQIRQIAQSAANDLRGQRDQRRALIDQAMGVFTAPNVDANAAEQVRQQMLAQHDATSRRITAAMVEVSRVLTPEQRAKLAERMKERRARMQERMDRMQRERGAAPQQPQQPQR